MGGILSIGFLTFLAAIKHFDWLGIYITKNRCDAIKIGRASSITGKETSNIYIPCNSISVLQETCD
jgi:hypothetical protein